MTDFVISGAGGFIGGHLMSAFETAGLRTARYDEFRDGRATARTFVHCANIHDRPLETAALTDSMLSVAAPRVERVVLLQTFATLHGLGTLDARAYNFGMSPVLMAPYGHGKMLQEKTVSDWGSRFPGLAIRLVYMPVVLGGGSWAANLEQARRNGVRLPPLMSASARANHIHVRDLSAHLLATQTDGAAGTKRVILNRPESRTLTWQEFFSGASVETERSARSMVRLALTLAELTAYRLRTVLRPDAMAAIAAHPISARPPDAAPYDYGARPLRFSGLIQQIVRLQPYLAAR